MQEKKPPEKQLLPAQPLSSRFPARITDARTGHELLFGRKGKDGQGDASAHVVEPSDPTRFLAPTRSWPTVPGRSCTCGGGKAQHPLHSNPHHPDIWGCPLCGTTSEGHGHSFL